MGIVFNNKPLKYVENELGSRVLTPNSNIHGRNVYMLEDTEEPDNPSNMERRVRKAKEVMWERWNTQYVRSLRERHNVTKSEAYYPDIGEVVLVVSDSKIAVNGSMDWCASCSKERIKLSVEFV